MAKKASNRRSTIAPAPSTDSESVRIRKINNGWIVSRSSVKRGRYVETEEFSAEKPAVTTAAPPKAGISSKPTARR